METGLIIGAVCLFLFFLYCIMVPRETHQSDEYFNYKFREPMSAESYQILMSAYAIRHQYPELTGPQLVALVYWGTC